MRSIVDVGSKPRRSGAVTKKAEGNDEKTPKFGGSSPAIALTAANAVETALMFRDKVAVLIGARDVGSEILQKQVRPDRLAE
jgi:hypothetical protein